MPAWRAYSRSMDQSITRYLADAKGDADPTEARFKMAVLDDMVAALRADNSSVSAAVTDTAQDRAALDALLYLNEANLVDAAISARFYLKSSHKEIFDSIKKMRFEKPTRLK